MKTVKLVFGMIRVFLSILLSSWLIGIELITCCIWMFIPGLREWIPNSMDKVQTWMERRIEHYDELLEEYEME